VTPLVGKVVCSSGLKHVGAAVMTMETAGAIASDSLMTGTVAEGSSPTDAVTSSVVPEIAGTGTERRWWCQQQDPGRLCRVWSPVGEENPCQPYGHP
jgi:hypothetical protein